MNPTELPDDTPIELEDGTITTLADLRAQEGEALQAIYSAFAGMRDEWVLHRSQSGVETRWRKAAAMYWGEIDDVQMTPMEDTLRNGPRRRAKTPERSRVVVNIVRPKVDNAVARMCELLLPSDDRNWGIGPTPMPDVVQRRVGDMRQTVDPATGQPTGLTADAEAAGLIQAAQEAAKAMERVIDDQLTEATYNAESRKGIENGVRLGTMVLIGPIPKKQINKVWLPGNQGRQSLELKEKTVPSTVSADPWDVFFDPACGNDHQRGAGFWWRRFATRKELRRLIGIQGYDTDAIKAVLETKPNRIRAAESRVQRELCKDDSYEMWVYHGEVEPDQMGLLSSRSGGNPLEDVTMAQIVMVNDKVISAIPSWIVDGTLPCDVWCWRQADDSPYGYGLPDELEHQQAVVNSAWRQVMDNAKVSLGPQIVMKKTAVVPAGADKLDYSIHPNKVWLAADDVEDVNKAFSTFDIPSPLEELLSIANTAMQFADGETSMPQLMNGNQGTGPTPETVGGMVMLFNNANTVLRLRVKQYDDRITVPHIGRYYDFNMVNNPAAEIKGDHEVVARGASALIERDIQAQSAMAIAQLSANPRYAELMKADEELRVILRAAKFEPEQLMKSADEIKRDQEAAAQQGAPADPRIESARMQLQAKQLEMEDRAAQRDFEGRRNQEENQLKLASLEYNKQREQAEFEIAQTAASLDRDMGLLKIQTGAQTTREALAAKERMELLKIDNDRQIFNAEAALRVRTGAGI